MHLAIYFPRALLPHTFHFPCLALFRVCLGVGLCFPPPRLSARWRVHPSVGRPVGWSVGSSTVPLCRFVGTSTLKSRETEARLSRSTPADVKSEDDDEYDYDDPNGNSNDGANANAPADSYLVLLEARLAQQRCRRLRRRLRRLDPTEAAGDPPAGTAGDVLTGGRFGPMRIVRRTDNGRGAATATTATRADSSFPGLENDGDVYAGLDVNMDVDDDDDYDDDDDVDDVDCEDDIMKGQCVGGDDHDVDDDYYKGGRGRGDGGVGGDGGSGDPRRQKEESGRSARGASRKRELQRDLRRTLQRGGLRGVEFGRSAGTPPPRVVYGAIVSGEDRLLLAMELLPAADLRVLLAKAERRLSREPDRGIAGGACAGTTFLRSKAAADVNDLASEMVLSGADITKV